MTPQDKAKDLVNQFMPYADSGNTQSHIVRWVHAKRCAEIAVANIVATLDEYGEATLELQNMDREFHYWHQVEQEIEKL